MKTKLLLLCMVMAALPQLFANNVRLSNIEITDQWIATHKCNIRFDISWENSWRTSTTVPTNWDACWLFAKYRVAGGEWHHCTLSTNLSDYTAPGGCTISPGTDGKGAFIYRSLDGSGSIDWTQITFPWHYGTDGVNDDAEVEVKLFAIEMVYITEGNFYIGDGIIIDESQYAFHNSVTYLAVQISSTLAPDVSVVSYAPYDDATLKSGIGIQGNGGLDTDNNGTIDNPYFPTGYRSFYMMKYEMSQEQYAEFLNTLNRTQQQARIATDIGGQAIQNVFVMSNTENNFPGNVIRCASVIPPSPQPVTFFCDFNVNGEVDTCDGQTLVCNLLSWPDLCAYADWAGLRPMTELEFEKSTRGPNTPVLGEYAWGNTNLATNGVSFGNYGCPDSWVELSPNEHTGRAVYGNIQNLYGLRRCGEFASSAVNHTRQEAGAGYYGVMEMSGSLTEPVVNIGTVAGRSFRAINGNGELNAAGDADVDYWPGINGNTESWTPSGTYGGTTGVTDAAGSGLKGGNMSAGPQAMQISSRYFVSMGFPTSRQEYHGARFVRDAF